MSDDQKRQPEKYGRGSLPPDAVNPPSQQHPHNAAEESADEAMATAEGDVSRHAGSPEEQASVQEMAPQRGQEDRRAVWMARHPDADE